MYEWSGLELADVSQKANYGINENNRVYGILTRKAFHDMELNFQ